MRTDWRQLSRAAGVAVTTNGLKVSLGGGRQHTLIVDEVDGDTAVLRLWSVAAPARVVLHPEMTDIVAWERNRTSDLVGFKVDGRGRLIGEAWVPQIGLDAEEWAIYVRAVAEACDRVEYLLTGRDEL